MKHNSGMDQDRQLKLPPEVGRKLGMGANGRVEVETREGHVILKPSIHRLRRVYLEVTNRCNLKCRTCMRNVWGVEGGRMTLPLYRKLLQEAAAMGEGMDFHATRHYGMDATGITLSQPQCQPPIIGAESSSSPSSSFSSGFSR